MNTSASMSVSEFGKDHGLIHEVVITGRKVGAGATFWSRLAHDEKLFRKIAREVMGMAVATAPLNPSQFIGKEWAIIPEERDPRSAALSEVDFSQVLFETCLKENESSIKGEEKLIRLKASKNIRPGATVFMGLWEDYREHKEDSVLECLFKERGITYLDFFGDVLLDPDGNRCVLSFYRCDDGVWRWLYYWLVHDWSAARPSASLASETLGFEIKSS